jgi:transposase-like protein
MGKKFVEDSRIVDLYVQGYTIRQVADAITMSREYVSKVLHRNDVKIRGRTVLTEQITKDILSEMYVQKRMSIREIAAELHVSYRAVLVRMERFGIKRRSLSEANRGGPNRRRYHILTVEKVREARRLKASGMSWSELEMQYIGIVPTTLKRAVRGISWAHVPFECSESVAEAAE